MLSHNVLYEDRIKCKIQEDPFFSLSKSSESCQNHIVSKSSILYYLTLERCETVTYPKCNEAIKVYRPGCMFENLTLN